jgi:hypothetical protein
MKKIIWFIKSTILLAGMWIMPFDVSAAEIVLATKIESYGNTEAGAPLVITDRQLPLSASLLKTSEGMWQIRLQNKSRISQVASIRLEQFNIKGDRISQVPFTVRLEPQESSTKEAVRNPDVARAQVVLTKINAQKGDG